MITFIALDWCFTGVLNLLSLFVKTQLIATNLSRTASLDRDKYVSVISERGSRSLSVERAEAIFL